MSKILLSIPPQMLKDFDAYLEKYSYERSEFIRRLIRGVVYPLDILPEVAGKKEKNIDEIVDEVVGDEDGAKALGKVPQTATENKIEGWCQVHFEKGVNYRLTRITWEDENGNQVIKEKWACPKCVSELENKGVGRLYYL